MPNHLQQRIISSFRHEPPPSTERVLDSNCHDYEGDTEFADAASAVARKDRAHVTIDDVRQISAYMDLLSSQALHYYIPAFLVASLEPGMEDVISDLLINLNPDDAVGLRQNKIERLSLFSREERSVVLDYLRYVYTLPSFRFDEEDVEDRLQEARLIEFWSD